MSLLSDSEITLLITIKSNVINNREENLNTIEKKVRLELQKDIIKKRGREREALRKLKYSNFLFMSWCLLPSKYFKRLRDSAIKTGSGEVLVSELKSF